MLYPSGRKTLHIWRGKYVDLGRKQGEKLFSVIVAPEAQNTPLV